MAGELTKTPPPLHVPGTPQETDSHITKPPTSHSTDDTVDAPVTDGGDDNAGDTSSDGNTAGGNGGGTNGGGVHVPGTHVSVPPLPTTNLPPVDEVLTLAQATVQCTLDGINQLLNPQAFQQCLNNYMNPKTTADKKAAASARSRLEKFYTLPTEAPAAG